MTIDDQVRDDVLTPAQRLEGARADLQRRRDLGDRVAAARRALATARTERTELARRVESEAADVERLEGGNATALWSRLRGRREGDLARERDELQKAKSALAAADARVNAFRADVDALVEQSHDLVDADAREQSALEDLALGGLAWDGLDPVQVAQARAEVDRRREVRELDLALATGAGLLQSLEVVRSLAASLHGLSWSDARDHSASWLKYEQLAELVPHLHAADDGLSTFAARAEPFEALRPGELPRLVAPQIDRRVRLVDEWLDDPVSDALVVGETRQLLTTARIALDRVEHAVAQLRRRRELVPSV